MPIKTKNLIIVFVTFIAFMLVFLPENLKAQGAFAPQQAGNQQPRSGLDTSSLNKVGNFGEKKEYTGTRVSLDFQGANVVNVIRLIAEVSGKNVVISEGVSGSVTLKLTNVPWDQALDILLTNRGLGMEEVDNVITISDATTLRNAKAAEAAAVRKTVEEVASMPLVKKAYTPRYAPVDAIRNEMSKIKTKKGTVIAVGNDIYVEDEADIQILMEQILLRNDKVARQILIEAKIIEAGSNFNQQIGVSWHGLGTAGTGTLEDTGITAIVDPSTNPLGDHTLTGGQQMGSILFSPSYGAALGLGFLNKSGTFGLTASLRASEIVGDTKVISSPRIMAANDETVTIKQGTQIPYTSVSENTATTEFQEAVLELTVTPHIEENGQIITLDIDLTKDSPGAQLGGSSEPSIDTKEVKTKLMVKDGTTVVIGGIITDTQTAGSNRVPTLHRIPILGWLFQDRAMTNNKDELLIFITANIIPVTI